MRRFFWSKELLIESLRREAKEAKEKGNCNENLRLLNWAEKMEEWDFEFHTSFRSDLDITWIKGVNWRGQGEEFPILPQ